MKFNPSKHRLPEFTQSGVLLVDKPKEWTSFDVANFVRSKFNIPKVGHCGTLDPAATGLLVLVLGKFTKLSGHFSGEDKEYEATMLLGTTTDTQDMDGNITATSDTSGLTADAVTATIKSFIGKQQQIPPMVSAVKVDGRRLYELARKGVEVNREPKDIDIKSINITRMAIPYVDFTVFCTKGAYIRTLCYDIGTKLNCGAVLHGLRRTRSGAFSLDNAISIETLKTWEPEDLQKHVLQFLFEKLAKMQGLTNF